MEPNLASSGCINTSTSSKVEMMSFEFPELLILEQSSSWNLNGSLTVRENYSGFDDSTSDYRKQLTRRNNQWYYKNPKNVK